MTLQSQFFVIEKVQSVKLCLFLSNFYVCPISPLGSYILIPPLLLSQYLLDQEVTRSVLLPLILSVSS